MICLRFEEMSRWAEVERVKQRGPGEGEGGQGGEGSVYLGRQQGWLSSRCRALKGEQSRGRGQGWRASPPWGGVADYRGCGLVKGVAKRGGFDGAWRAQPSVEGLGKH